MKRIAIKVAALALFIAIYGYEVWYQGWNPFHWNVAGMVIFFIVGVVVLNFFIWTSRTFMEDDDDGEREDIPETEPEPGVIDMTKVKTLQVKFVTPPLAGYMFLDEAKMKLWDLIEPYVVHEEENGVSTVTIRVLT